jgi:small-conductance mechanosensitive channel
MDWSRISALFHRPLFTLGDTSVSLANTLKAILVIILVFVLARLVRRLVRRRLLPHTRLAPPAQELVARATGWIIIVLGFTITLATLGVNLTSLTVLGGALGIGIGFGLQNIVGNFVSGLIILTERPIQVGHRVEVGDAAGQVTRIGSRSTSILTNDNITLIIPNTEFISSRVVNWSHAGDRRVRIKVQVPVSYGSDVRLVERVLLEVARANESTLAVPEPRVVFREFGDSALKFELRLWTETMSQRPGAYRSQINFAIWEAFAQAGVHIPFPQHEVRVQGPVRVEIPAAPRDRDGAAS